MDVLVGFDMGFLVRTFSWPVVVGANWLKERKLKSKIFRLILDEESIEFFDAHKSTVGFEVLKGLMSEPEIQVLSLEIDSIPRNLSAQQELRDLLMGFKSRFGRTIFVHLRNPTFLGYWLASVGDYIHIAPCQDIFLIPIANQSMFYGRLLDILGIQADIIAAGKCKSLGEPYTRSFPSQPNREQITTLFEQIQAHIAQEIWNARKETSQHLDIASFSDFQSIIDSGMMSASKMKELGLIDTTSYIDEYEKAIAKFTHREYKPIDMSIASLLKIAVWDKKLDISTQIAQVNLSGTIVEQSSGGQRIDSKTCIKVLYDLRKNDAIKGVLLVIDSPGGSAIASDRIARAIDKLMEKKPVVAFMKGMAASGGYYIACRCLHITAQPTTITGSIGVVGGKVAFGKTMERIGITSELISGGNKESASLFSTWTPFTENQRTQMKELLEETYERFLQIVSGGRKMPMEQVRKLAEGRVYTGLEALRIGLVDQIGGIEDAKKHLAQRIGVKRVKTVNITIKKKASVLKRVRQFAMGGVFEPQKQISQMVDSVMPETLQILLEHPYQPLMLLPTQIDTVS